MIKARNKKLSMLLVLAMLMTMFVGVGTASAAGTEYITLTAPTISTDSDDFQKLGRVSIDIDDVRTIPEVQYGDEPAILAELSAVLSAKDAYDDNPNATTGANLLNAQDALTEAIADASGEWFTISLPSGCEFEDPVGSANVLGMVPLAGIKITPSDNIEVLVIKISSKNSAEVKVASKSGDRDGDMLVEFNGIKVKSGSGNVDATFLTPGDGTFPMGTATIAKIGSGATTVMAKSVKTFGDSGGEIDTIIIAENRAGVFEANETIELRLPKGFTWDDSGVVEGAWGMAGKTYVAEIKSGSSDRILVVKIGSDVSDNAAGRVNIGTSKGFFEINVEDTAKLGDIYVTVSSNKDAVEKQDILVAKYGDYGVLVEEGTTEEVYSGRAEQELGKFYIEEQIEGSLIANRSMYFELPKGVKWQFENGDPVIEMKSEDGTGLKTNSVKFTKVANTGDRKVRVNFEFDNNSSFSDEAVKLVVKDMEVRVEPSFTGEIAVTVSGNAGVEGEAVVAEAIKPITLKSEGPTKVEIGAMNQKAADILIIEEVDGAILDEYLDSTIFDEEYGTPQIVVSLPKGVEFYDDPVVKVEEGDLEIDDVDYFDGYLVITIDSSSSKKSVIRISDVFLTVDRTVPEGDVLAKFAGHKVENSEIIGEGCSAFVNWATEESYGNVVAATTITPSQGGHAKFVIGSNIYEIGGIPYVMDAVPYIKDSRSYVPMRYLAQMLGAEVTWEQADQTVTLSNKETTVVFTIGSTTYTVNGEAKTADVAPEIVNDRAFLPARFAAEAFGAQVGWDEALQTVIIIR